MKKGSIKTFPGGSHIVDKKFLTRENVTEKLPRPEDVFISLSQHIGAPAISVVEEGSLVKKGQLLAKLAGTVSANIYASVSGKVVGLIMKKTAMGASTQHIHIKSSGEDETLLKSLIDREPNTILKRIEEAGIVGMGGAGFPTSVKLNSAKPIDTLLINGAECEPYLTCDERLVREKSEQVLLGAKLMATACGASDVIFCIEANKPECIEILEKANAKVIILKKKYPQGAEKHLIFAALKRRVEPGKLPAEVGVVVQNIATAFAVYNAVELNMPLTERIMTVSGEAISCPKNIVVPIGTPLKNVIEFCGGTSEDTAKLIVGGPMMGFAISETEIATTKGTNGLIALTKAQAQLLDPTPCINCGKCARVCPMKLMPMFIDAYALANEFDYAVKYGALNCMECGCCAYVCPARRAIVQSVRYTKAKLKEKKS